MEPIPSDADEEPKGHGPAHWPFGTTADVGIGARGGSPEELFEQLGEGFTDLTTDLSRVRPKERREVRAGGSSPEGLVVAYLSELIGLFDTEGWLAARFHVTLEGNPPTGLRAELEGETFDPARHPERVMVKAITLHRLQLDLRRGRARVVVDI